MCVCVLKIAQCLYAIVLMTSQSKQSLSGKWRCLDKRTIIAWDKISYAPLSQTDKEYSLSNKQFQDEIRYL